MTAEAECRATEVEGQRLSAADVRRETELRQHPVSPTARISAFPELVDVLEDLDAMDEKEALGKPHDAPPFCSTARAGA